MEKLFEIKIRKSEEIYDGTNFKHQEIDVDFYVNEEDLFHLLKWKGDNLDEIQKFLDKYNENHKNNRLYLNVVDDCLYIFTETNDRSTYSRRYFSSDEAENYIRIYPYRTDDPLGFNNYCDEDMDDIVRVSRTF